METKVLFRRIREWLGFTQAEMAKRLLVRQNTISQYESGKTEPGLEVLIRAEMELNMGGVSNPELSAALRPLIQNRIQRASPLEIEALPIIAVDDRYEDFANMMKSVTSELRNLRVAPALIRILQLYRKTENNSRFWPVIERAAAYIEVEISNLGATQKPPRRRSAKQVDQKRSGAD